jgi:hypothetical protein
MRGKTTILKKELFIVKLLCVRTQLHVSAYYNTAITRIFSYKAYRGRYLKKTVFFKVDCLILSRNLQLTCKTK